MDLIDSPIHRSVRYYRTVLLGGGIAYLIWWLVIKILLPSSFNPLGSRLAVVGICLGILGASYFSTTVLKHIEVLFLSALWIITFHYFYLFFENHSDINWVVGSYVVVIAATACLQSEIALIAYGGFVFLLSLLLVIEDRTLLHTIFLPGITTGVFFAYLGLRSRLKLSQETIETSERFQNLFDAVFEGIVVHEDGYVKDCNHAFARLLGYPRHELIGKRVSEFMTPEAAAGSAERLKNPPSSPYEIGAFKKDGSLIQVEIRVKEIKVRGKSYRMAAIIDITDRKKNEHARVLYEASQESIRMRDEFLSTASHELKTPLTNLKLQSQIALRSIQKLDPDALAPERMVKFIQQTNRQADRLNLLVEEMLDVSKIVSGKMEIDAKPFDLVPLMKEVIQGFEHIMAQAGCSVELKGPPSATLMGDPFRIEQVLINLLSNAVKYGKGSSIEIQIEETPQEVRFFFQDHGIGIAKEDQARIFRRFERAISAKKISGLGLGLYISKHVVDLHLGEMRVESEPGKGSRFTVVIPHGIQESTS